MQESTNRRIMVQEDPGTKGDPISKITRAERADKAQEILSFCI
jgi:hypothetical protein